MSDQTTTTTPSATGFFDFSALGAVTLTSTRTVTIPPARLAAYRQAVSYFTVQAASPTPISQRIMEIPCEQIGVSADVIRREIQQYADDNKLTAGFPKFVGEQVPDPLECRRARRLPVRRPPRQVAGEQVGRGYGVHRDRRGQRECRWCRRGRRRRCRQVGQVAPLGRPGIPSLRDTGRPATRFSRTRVIAHRGTQHHPHDRTEQSK